MAKKVRIGVLGAGRIGKMHITNLVNSIQGAEVVVVADPFMNDETAQWVKDLGIAKATKDAEEVFTNPDVDAVFICSSTATHAEFIVKAAEAGKHIFCEKPISTDVKVIEDALAAVDKAGVKLQVGFVRRFDHNHKKVRDTVASGMLGEPAVIKVTSRDPEGPSMDYIATSGGIFLDQMIHDFDMVRYLSGSEVTEVTTYGAVRIDEEYKKYDDVDTAIVMLKFANGALGVIENSREAGYGYDQRTEVHCRKGCVRVENDLNDTATISTREGVTCAKPTWFFLERYTAAFLTETEDFVSAILEGKDVPVTGIDGLMPVKIAIAAKKSLDEGRAVKISEI